MDENNNKRASVQEQAGLTLRDMVAMCLHRWPWFVLSVLICAAVAVFYILRTPPVYTRSASVLIKEDRKGRSIAADVQSSFSDLGLVQSNVNVNNEIINFSSPDMMMEVVKRLNLDVEYMQDHRLYDLTLYGSTLPLKVEFFDLGNSEFAYLEVLPVKDSVFTLTSFKRNNMLVEGAEPVSAAMGDTLSTPLGRILISPSTYQDVPPLSAPLHVSRSSLHSAASRFSSALTVTLANKQATVIDLKLNDVNRQRAVEVLNMLINVYNEKWIKDKNQITTSTNEFIADRLEVIESELGNVDSNISTAFRISARRPAWTCRCRARPTGRSWTSTLSCPSPATCCRTYATHAGACFLPTPG